MRGKRERCSEQMESNSGATAEEGKSKAYAGMSKRGRIRTHSERTKNAFHMGFYAVLYTNHFRKPTKKGQAFYECPRPKAL